LRSSSVRSGFAIWCAKGITMKSNAVKASPHEIATSSATVLLSVW
jgi:hypothetical protein